MPYAKHVIEQADIEAMAAAMQENFITRGPKVEAFENALAEYCGAKFAVAFNSGTTALNAACHAAGVTKYDRIITTPNTFVATAFAGMHYGATPIFVDIDRSTGNLNIEQVSDTIRQPFSRGRYVVMPVHFSGIPVDMHALDNVICDPEAVVIEDAAHAIGSTYADGQKVGCCAYSQMTMFSFHPAKTITTGEGGAITTNDPELYRRLKLYRNNGIERDPQYLQNNTQIPFEGYYEVIAMTGNYNFTDFQAALGLSQLKRIDSLISKRRQLVKKYRQLLNDIPYIKLFTDAFDAQTAFHLFVVQIDFAACKTSRATVIAKLKEKGIGTQVHYIPVYRHPFVQNKSGDISSYFPEMETYYSQALSLPLYTSLNEDDIVYIVNNLKEILSCPEEPPKAPEEKKEKEQDKEKERGKPHHGRHRHVRRMRR